MIASPLGRPQHTGKMYSKAELLSSSSGALQPSGLQGPRFLLSFLVCWALVKSEESHSTHTLPLDAAGFGNHVDGQAVTKLGSSALMEGRWHRAASIFTAGVALHTQDASIWNNFAVALASFGAEQGGWFGKELLCEARAAAQLAFAKGYQEAKELLAAMQTQLDTIEHEATDKSWSRFCGHRAGNEISEEDDVVDAVIQASSSTSHHAEDERQHIQQVNRLCAVPGKVMLRPSSRERRLGTWRASSLRKAWTLLSVCGIVVVDGLMSVDVVGRAASALASTLPWWSETLSAWGPPNKAFESVQAASRGSLRQEVKLPLSLPFTDEALTAPPLLRSLVKLILGERVELDTFSCIDSSPGSKDQAWHNDVPTPTENGCQQPPVGLVSVIPLVEVDARNGATEFLAGSHVKLGGDRFWMGPEEDDGRAEENGGGASTRTPHLQIPANRGAVILFDIRLRHRGRANHANASRPVLYISYVKDWFRDSVNFKEKQTEKWSALPKATRRLFARLDSREYIRVLEEALEQRGVSVHQLASAVEYKQAHLEL